MNVTYAFCAGMNIDSLRLFTEVAQKLSFAAVANCRGVNPSSVARAISQLEKVLGVRLFQRSTRRMALTEAGVVLLGRFENILDEFDEATDQARAISLAPMGTLRLTASVAFGERIVVPLVPEFRALYPDIKLELLFTNANLDLVSEGIDIAIRLGERIDVDVVATRLFKTRFVVCATPEYLQRANPIRTPEEIQHHRCILYDLPRFRSNWRFRLSGAVSKEECEGIELSLNGDVLLTSALSQRSLVLQNEGPALLADWLIGDDLSEGRLINLFPEYDFTPTGFNHAAWIIYPNRAFLPRKVRVTIDFLKSKFDGR